jgi:hypothetical protein
MFAHQCCGTVSASDDVVVIDKNVLPISRCVTRIFSLSRHNVVDKTVLFTFNSRIEELLVSTFFTSHGYEW